jgi:hypothetical protein
VITRRRISSRNYKLLYFFGWSGVPGSGRNGRRNRLDRSDRNQFLLQKINRTVFVRVSRATLKMATQIITPVTNLPERVCKKRNRDAGLVCVIINQVESEYDGCFTGGIETSRGVITEV